MWGKGTDFPVVFRHDTLLEISFPQRLLDVLYTVGEGANMSLQIWAEFCELVSLGTQVCLSVKGFEGEGQ